MPERRERNRAIYEQSRAGRSFPDLARAYGISRSRVHQIVSRMEERERWWGARVFREWYPDWPTTMPYPTLDLTTRACNVYVNAVLGRPWGTAKVSTVDDLLALLESQTRTRRAIRNCGPLTRRELQQWLSQPPVSQTDA